MPTEFEEESDGRPVAVTSNFGPGMAEYVSQSPYDALLRLDKPVPGVAAFGAFNCGGQSMIAVNFYHYGDQAAGTVAHETPMWRAWFQECFPMPLETSASEMIS